MLKNLITPLNKLPQFIFWLILTTIILGLSILTSFFPIWANIPINVILPIIFLIFFKTVFFEKLKVMTLVILRAVVVVAVILDYYYNISGQWFGWVVIVFLAINILEATFTDLKVKKYFNFVTGLVLAASVVTLLPKWYAIEGANRLSFMYIYEANTQLMVGTVCWIIAYTIWNWIFVTNEFSPSIAYHHIGILGAPLIGCLIFLNPGFWLVFRANSLLIGGLFQISLKSTIENKLKNKSFINFVNFTKKNSVQLVLMIINLILIAVPVFYFIFNYIN